MADAVSLSGRRLYALPLVYALGERVSSHSPSTKGYAPVNCYLLVERGHALLIDTGFSIHERELMRHLDVLLPKDGLLTLWALRVAEFASVCNVRPIVDRFRVDALYGSQSNAAAWVDFRPEYPLTSSALDLVESRVARPGAPIAIGMGDRRVVPLPAPLRLLPTHWAYDEATKTLFTADAFAYTWRGTAAGPWVITSDDDPTTRDAVWEQLVNSRFWWLAKARTEQVRTAIAEIFQAHDVDTIAPSHGCILHGRPTVQRHLRLLDDLLA